MTSKATIGSAAKERDGLSPKDFVFIAVFGILLFLVFMVFSIIFSANANLCWFTHTVGALFAGTVFMYLAYRVPKRGAIAIMGIIVGAVGLLMGMFWSGPVGIVVGGIVADLIAGDPQKRTKTKLICAFAAFTQDDVTARADLSAYSDAGQIPSWAMDAMQWANARQLIIGRDSAHLAPVAATTRAEMASILSAYIRK
mgnify:CR=1 FL=1